ERPDGQMFYSITYGKGVMGAHASQLNQKERWQVINYINSMKGAEVMEGPCGEAKMTIPAVTIDTVVAIAQTAQHN
ncbi:MAG: hypothetical protein ABF272_03010, partial [Flavobacteriales bacterium]